MEVKSGLEISNVQDLIFGISPNPIQCGREVVIGNGEVYPEINFTLPSMLVDQDTWPEVRSQYSEMIREICQRAVDLQTPALVVEFELLPPMTINPGWGAEITEILNSVLNEFYEKYGLRSALRVTPVDIRDMDQPPRMRSGEMLEKTLQSFEHCARSGADILSIESTGGKEIHDAALMNADLAGIVFALGVLAVRDMQFLWKEIVQIANHTKTIPGGDTACGFANTAMALADQRLIPKTLAAAVRVASVARSLQAYLQGAVGPSKDCAYEGPYLKALMGIPISMEGKSSACAHLSSLGNIASACSDLLSNESVQNVRLLSASAPVVSLEQLVYDCRLMNRALDEGKHAALKLQQWLIESDAPLDPQAYVLKPDVVINISHRLLDCATPLEMTLAAVDQTLTTLRQAHQKGELQLDEQERRWLDLLSIQLESIPADEELLWSMIKSKPYYQKMDPHAYALFE